MLFAAPPKKSEQVEEQVDEVQIECQAAQKGQLLRLVVNCIAVGQEHPFDFLCIIGGKSHEDEYANATYNEIKGAVAHKHVDHCSDDEPNERHEQETPP